MLQESELQHQLMQDLKLILRQIVVWFALLFNYLYLQGCGYDIWIAPASTYRNTYANFRAAAYGEEVQKAFNHYLLVSLDLDLFIGWRWKCSFWIYLRFWCIFSYTRSSCLECWHAHPSNSLG